MPVSIVIYMLTAVGAYFLGSIPTGYLVAKARGVEIRSLGSGNIGATNVFRYLGLPAGILVLFCDALKGYVAVMLSRMLLLRLNPSAGEVMIDSVMILAALCAVLGHNYTFWLRFKGGKGIATSAGVLVALVPAAFVVILVVWAIVLATTRYMSLASVLGAATLPFAVWGTTGSLTLIIVTAAMSILAIFKHRSNIKRLLNGTETRFGKKPIPPTAP